MALTPDKEYGEPTPLCRECMRALWSRLEQEFKTCNYCLDDMAEREHRRREFIYYHPPGDDD